MLLMFAGPSTAGKDARWLTSAEQLAFTRMVPYTTRPRRPNEREGHDYCFISRAQFYALYRERKLAEWDYILDHHYGFPLELVSALEADQNVCIQVRATMGLRIRQRFSNSRIIMLAASDSKTLENRLRARGHTDEDVRARIRHGMEEMAQAPLCDLLVPDADILSEIDARRILEDYLFSR
jgi:guanylate kinase